MAQAPIIVIKKKAAHGGHHGGAWKVAYADFVTAMMALFIVLWLLNSSSQVRVAVGGYFKDPTGTSKKVGNAMMGSGENFSVTKDNVGKIKDELQASIRKVTVAPNLKDQIEMTVTGEGLRIDLMETDKAAFFPSGSVEPSAPAKEILDILAAELGKLPNAISIEGHTDAKPFGTNGNYGNWELSADRANAARRVMEKAGLAPRQVSQVRGYADQRLKKPQAPEDASNRRITIIVQYTVKPDEDDKPEKAEAGTPASAPKPAKDAPVNAAPKPGPAAATAGRH
jgi:chemotaxis protein MotB